MKTGLEELNLFRHVVLCDQDLQEQLRETPDKESFLDLMITLGHARGYQFSIADVEAALLAAHRTWLERWIG
jgi:hypothetical protein